MIGVVVYNIPTLGFVLQWLNSNFIFSVIMIILLVAALILIQRAVPKKIPKTTMINLPDIPMPKNPLPAEVLCVSCGAHLEVDMAVVSRLKVTDGTSRPLLPTMRTLDKDNVNIFGVPNPNDPMALVNATAVHNQNPNNIFTVPSPLGPTGAQVGPYIPGTPDSRFEDTTPHPRSFTPKVAPTPTTVNPDLTMTQTFEAIPSSVIPREVAESSKTSVSGANTPSNKDEGREK
jgi:hypothetical protein